jgi:hypothetical protein
MKSFFYGVCFTTIFFTAIGFTTDGEDAAAEVETAFLAGVIEGSKQASLKRCNARAFLTEGM